MGSKKSTSGTLIEVLERSGDVGDRVVQRVRAAEPAVDDAGGGLVTGAQELVKGRLEQLDPLRIATTRLQPEHPGPERGIRSCAGRLVVLEQPHGRLGVVDGLVPGVDRAELVRRREAVPGSLQGVGCRAGGTQVGRDGGSGVSRPGRQGLRGAEVQCAQVEPREGRAERLADEVVGERVAAQPRRPGLDEEALGHGVVQRGRDLLLGQPDDLREQLDVDRGPQHGRHRQDVPGCRRQGRQAVAKDVLDAGWHLPRVAVLLHRAGQRRRHLRGVEGVTTGVLPQPMGVAVDVGDGRAEEVSEVLLAQGAERDPLDDDAGRVPQEREQSRAAAPRGGAEAHDKHDSGREAGHHVPEQA